MVRPAPSAPARAACIAIWLLVFPNFVLLDATGPCIKQAARQSGYGSEAKLRRAFVLQLGVLPSDYQARFA